jgi:hypothetical protein
MPARMRVAAASETPFVERRRASPRIERSMIRRARCAPLPRRRTYSPRALSGAIDRLARSRPPDRARRPPEQWCCSVVRSISLLRPDRTTRQRGRNPSVTTSGRARAEPSDKLLVRATRSSIRHRCRRSSRNSSARQSMSRDRSRSAVWGRSAILGPDGSEEFRSFPGPSRGRCGASRCYSSQTIARYVFFMNARVTGDGIFLERPAVPIWRRDCRTEPLAARRSTLDSYGRGIPNWPRRLRPSGPDPRLGP